MNLKTGIPTVKECIQYIESCGWKFSHRSIVGTYVFRHEDGEVKNCKSYSEVAFTLHELRHAFKYGW